MQMNQICSQPIDALEKARRVHRQTRLPAYVIRFRHGYIVSTKLSLESHVVAEYCEPPAQGDA